ncbi:hypothetical protein Z043_104421 [Scleropages formosus]|uniref:Uncharacterized protein n=1 Tax=Scleropages formosus TaxID=113540 RepID=A0A0P7UP18_SCLFO|nr:hypothetical protein Z043_104421 [Scleropages formosus]
MAAASAHSCVDPDPLPKVVRRTCNRHSSPASALARGEAVTRRSLRAEGIVAEDGEQPLGRDVCSGRRRVGRLVPWYELS